MGTWKNLVFIATTDVDVPGSIHRCSFEISLIFGSPGFQCSVAIHEILNSRLFLDIAG
jgi:hypothetical protein